MNDRQDDKRIKHLHDWLRDAHAMEEQAETMLKSMAGRLEHYPDLKARVEQHIVETQGQARQLRECIERVGASTSTLKDLGGKLMANAQAFTGMFSSDEVVKGVLFSYAFEHMEIASYRSLIAAARTLGASHIEEVCTRILVEEEAMADWLEDYLPVVTQQFLENAHRGQAAKR